MHLEAYDLSTPPLAYANPGRYPSDSNKRMYIVCPLDGFTPKAREEQMAKVEGCQDHPLTAGLVLHHDAADRTGTDQGNWFVNREVGGFTDISKELVLAHHHVHCNSGAISAGGTIMDRGVWVFMEENEGLVKRGFDQVVPDGQIYCYQGAISSESGQGPPMLPGRLLISLTSETEMQVDRQDGECVGELDFVNPTTYYR